MSRTSSFLQRNNWAQSDSKTPAYAQSKTIVFEFKSLMFGQNKTSSTKESAVANKFLFISFLNESFWYAGFCQHWYFWNSFLISDGVINICCTQNKGREQTAPCQDNGLLTRWLKGFMRREYLSVARISLLCPNFLSFWVFVRWCLFTLYKFPFSRFIMQSQRNQMNSFVQYWTETFLLCGKTIGTFAE